MEKVELEKFINNLAAANVNNYSIRYEGGNRFSSSNSESSRIRLTDEYAIVAETDSNYGSKSTLFTVKAVPYGNIDDASAYDLTTKQLIDFLNAEGVLDDDLKQFVGSNGNRVLLKPGHGGYGEIQDKDGNPIIDSNLPGRVTTGSSV